MRKLKTKLLLSSIAASAITLSSQTANTAPLVPALKSSVASKATTNSVSFPPVLSASTFTTGREERIQLSLNAFNSSNPGFYADFQMVDMFALNGTIGAGTMDIIPLQFGSFAFNVVITDTSTNTIVETQNYNLIVNETSKFTVSKFAEEVSLEIGETTSLELISNYRYKNARIEFPSIFDIDQSKDQGRIYSISGAFTEPGVYYVDTRVISWNDEVFEQTVKYTVVDSSYSDFDVSDADLTGKVGNPISHTVGVSGGIAPFTYAIVWGSLPDGLALNDGVISGTPTKSGKFFADIEIIDDYKFSNPKIAMIDFDISAADVVELPDLAMRTKVGDSFSQKIDATGGEAPYTYAIISGTLPSGLLLSDNEIKGEATEDGSYSITIQVTDKNGIIASKAYSISVSPADAVVELPVVENGKLELDYGQSGSINLADLVTGDFDTISITKSAEKGEVKLSGTTATFTPALGAVGSDRFDFIASNSAGSVTGSVTISIKEPIGLAPIAINHVINLDPTKSGSIDLTFGAISSDPILKSHILNSVSANTGTIELSGSTLDFKPYKAFAGRVVVGYQLQNKFGRSNVATVTFKVAERPDPSKDPEVVALIKAQVDSAIKLADDQIDNILRRLEQIRSEAPGKRKNSFDLSVGVDSENNETRLHDGTEIEDKQSQNIRTDFESESPIAGWFTGYVRVGDDEYSGLDFKTTAVGFTAGADYRFNENFVGGVSVGYGREHSKIGDNATENVAQAISTALYGTWHTGSGAFVDGMIGYQKLDMDSTRFVTPNSQFAYGSRSGSVVFGSVIAGYDYKFENGLKLTPYAGVRGIIGKLDGFSEDGDDIYGLTYGSTDIRSISGVAGVGVEKTFDSENWTITPTAKIEYRYDFASGTRTNIGYTDILSDVGMPYVVHTDVDERSTVVASAGLRVKPKNSDLTLEAAVQGNLNGNSKSVRFSAKATYSFCGIGVKKTDCMSLEQRVVYLKAELAKAQKAKNKQQISELKKLLAKTEKELKVFNKRSNQMTPIPDADYTFRLK